MKQSRSFGMHFGTALAAVLATLAAARLAHADDRARGSLIRAIPLGHLDPAAITTRVGGAGFDASTVRFGVDLFRLEYRTIDPDDRPTTATGLVALPADGARASVAVSFTHGTELMKRGAPSTSVDADDAFVVSPGLIYASAGFVASLPDYLGMGKGPGLHPYMDVPSETSATLDMLRATRQFCAQHQRRLARSVLVSGFSQGAFPALGLARELSAGADPWFRLGALAPISGPYRWSRWVHDAIAGTGRVADLDPAAASVYLAYFSVAWNRLHHLYTSPATWYLPRYAAQIDAMMDGSHTPAEILGFLPQDPTALFTDLATAAFEAPTGRLAAAFDVIDRTCAFAASAPVRLFAASGDPDIEIRHSQDCRADLAARGSQVDLVDLGATDHIGSNLLGTADTVAWFIALRDRGTCSADD